MNRREFLARAGGAALVASVGRPLSHAAAAEDASGGVGGTISYLEYELTDGWVHHWLIAGPHVVAIPAGSYRFVPELRPPIVKQFFRAEPQVTDPPVEGDTAHDDGDPLTWAYAACGVDHLLDQAYWFGSSRYARGWAFVRLDNGDADRDVSVELFTNGPADAWLNGRHVHRSEAFDYVDPKASRFVATLRRGENALLVRREQVMDLAGPLVLAARLTDAGGAGMRDVRTLIPTRTADPATRQFVQSAFEGVRLSRDGYGKGDEILLLVPPLDAKAGPIDVQVKAGGRTVKTATWDAKAGAMSVPLGRAADLPAGRCRVLLTGQGEQRALAFDVRTSEFLTAPAPGHTDTARRDEAMRLILARGGAALDPRQPPGNLMWTRAHLAGEIAKMHLVRWDDLQESTLVAYLNGIDRREDGADFVVLEIAATLARFGTAERLPKAWHERMGRSVVGMKYWLDEPGRTAMNFGSENHQLAIHSAEILAGQLFPDATFTNNGKDGRWHRRHGEAMALVWLERRAAYGFNEWDANGYLAHEINTLAHLSSLAQDPRIKTLARQVLDKVFLCVALNSYRGCFGSTHGRSKGEYVKDARHEETASLAYVGWGLSMLNEDVDLTLGLLLADYHVPDAIRAIALDLPEAYWGRERQGLAPEHSTGDSAQPVDKVTFRTPDFMLASAQSWQPGKAGYQQHVWQATLGPDAVTFVTHPPFLSENGNHRPDFWSGNKTLPRVAQWRDSLMAVHRSDPACWLDWTHAYFPTWAFDEWAVTPRWAFARKGDGYVALAAAGGLRLVKAGDTAYRELRSPGLQNVWLCQMGRRAIDGDFAAFKAAVEALPVAFDGPGVRWTNLRGQALAFGWDGPLTVDATATAINDFRHFDTPYCAADWPSKRLEIRCGTDVHVLDFGSGHEDGSAP